MRMAFVSLVLFFVIFPLVSYSYQVDLHYSWRAEDLTVSEFKGFDLVGVRDASYIDGSLGQIVDLRVIPHGYTVAGYTIRSEEWQSIDRQFRVGFLQGDKWAAMIGDEEGGLEGVSSIDLFGFQVLTVAIRPTRFVDGKLSLLKKLDISISLEPEPDPITVSRRSYNADRQLRHAIESVTGQALSGYGGWIVEDHKDWVSESPSPDGSVVDCVIVTVDSLVAEFERLAAWHNRRGIRTVVRTVEWISGKYHGADLPEKIRNFLRDAYQEWGTVYVLIGGSPEVVPIRYAWTNYYGGESIPTDVYYQDLKGNWNADGDDIYGEYGKPPLEPGDSLGLYEHLISGRAPVRNSAEARAFIDKTIAYATQPAPGFAASALFLGEVIFPVEWKPGDPISFDGKSICDSASTYFPAGFDTLKLYESQGSMDRTLCLNAFNVGYNFNIIAGHGDAFRTSTGQGNPPFIHAEDFDTLSNTNRWGFVYALNCNNLAVDVDCIFRHFLLNPEGGIVAAHATTRYDFPTVGRIFLYEFLDVVFNRGVNRLGDAIVLHHIRLIPSALLNDGTVRWLLFTYLLAGDPVLDLWVDEEKSFEVIHPSSISLGDSIVTVQVRDGGVGLPEAIVVLEGDHGEYGVGLTGSDGVASVRFKPRGTGSCGIYVSRNHYLMYEDSLEVTGDANCYVSSVRIDDGQGQIGNGDGKAGWGEIVGLGVGLRNGGSGTIQDVIGRLSAVSGCSLGVYVEVDSVANDGLIHIGRNCKRPSGIPFVLQIDDHVFGRCYGSIGKDLGCWIWLDANGWHIRFIGDKYQHTYACSLEVFGDLVGLSGYGLETEDLLAVQGGKIVLTGNLGNAEYEDGVDLQIGAGKFVAIYEDSVEYGNVGGDEVIGWFEVGFDTAGVGDGLGLWFEIEIQDQSLQTWKDWVWLEVLDGDLVRERVRYENIGGDTVRAYYGVRNCGGGVLVGVNGKCRSLDGISVIDSTSTYGDMAGNGYSEGEGFVLSGVTPGSRYEVVLSDQYGREWKDTVLVRSIDRVVSLTGWIGSDYMDLRWGISGDSLFVGYDIYRADSLSGDYHRVGMVEGYARYLDTGLSSEEEYCYYVVARDVFGNLSEPSETLQIWTGAPYVPGFPVEATNCFPSSPVLADIDRDSDLEVIIGSKDHYVYVWHHDGTVAQGWPRKTAGEIWSSAAVANLDSDPQLEIIIGTDEGWLYGWNYDGSPIRYSNGRFANTGGTCRTPPAIDDIDGDGDFEILAGNSGGSVFAWHHDGTGYLQSNGLFAQCSGAITGSPTIADLDADGDVEIIVGSHDGYLYVWHHDGTGYKEPGGLFATPGGGVYGSIAVGDIDYNGDMEIVAGSIYGKKVIVYGHTGSYHPGWPQDVDCYIYGSPALADLDGDNRLDIVIGTQRSTSDQAASVYVFSDSGAIRSGWPVTVKGDFFSSPVVGDIDGDGHPDIVIGCTDGRVYAFDRDGVPLRGWPRFFIYSFYSTPAIADLDNDGDVDVVIGGYDAKVHAFDISAPYNRLTMKWPKLCHDLLNSGLYNGPSKAGVDGGEDPFSNTIPQNLSILGYPNPAYGSLVIRLGVPDSPRKASTSVSIYDVRGRLVRELFSGELAPGYKDLVWDGKDENQSKVASGIYFIKASSGEVKSIRKIVLLR
ncbi:MAG: C25 family cysteine peptidase [bacterium]